MALLPMRNLLPRDEGYRRIIRSTTPVGILDAAGLSNGVRRLWSPSLSLPILLISQLQAVQCFPTSPTGTKVTKHPRRHPACTDVSSNAVLPLLQKISSRSTCGPSESGLKHVAGDRAKRVSTSTSLALQLENAPVSGTAVLMKCTAGTFQLDFLTERYGLSGGLSCI